MSSQSSKYATPTYIIRPAKLSDGYTMAAVASRAYYHTPFTQFLSPGRHEYPRHYVFGFQRWIVARMLNPRNRSYVAVSIDDLDTPVGYCQVTRLGEDDGAKSVIKEKKRWWSGIAELAFKAGVWLAGWIWKDRSTDNEALMDFVKSGELENKKHWDGQKDRENRWYVNSCVVAEEWRGKGVGKALLKDVLERAQKEGVVVGLEASSMGEWLYRSVGFEVLGRFMRLYGDDEVNGGGIMMWTPKKIDGKS
jgi:ribosomal protein S18 acetylase RimI-like enzyme